ncbi:MAG: cupredoxin family copper-binding protein [Nitrospinota bacterium]
MRVYLKAFFLFALAGAFVAAGGFLLNAEGGEKVVEVVIKGFAYRPAEITISPGQSVRWIHKDAAPHTVTSGVGKPDGKFDSGNMTVGASFTQTFTSPGTYSYYCAIHPFMKAKVVVKGAQGGY